MARDAARSGAGVASTAQPLGLVGERLREVVTHSTVYGLGAGLQAVAGLGIIPVYTREFSAAEFGRFSLITIAATLAAGIFYLGASSALARSYFDNEGDERRAAVATSLWIALAGAGMQLGLGFFLAPVLAGGLGGMSLVPILLALSWTALQSVNGVFLMILRLERRSRLVVVLSAGSQALGLALAGTFLIVADMGMAAPFFGLLLGQVVAALGLVLATRRWLSLRPDRTEAKLQLRFGLPNVVSGLLYYVLDTLDRVFISAYGTLADVGVYSLGYRFGVFIHTLYVIPVSMIWQPMRLEYRKEAGAPRLFSLMLTYYLTVGVLIISALSIFSDNLVDLFAAGDAYSGAAAVIPLVLLAHLVYGGVNFLDNGIVFFRRMILHVYIFAGAVAFNVLANWVLVPRFGFMGAAYSTVASYLIVAASVTVVSNRLYAVPWEWGRAGRLFAWGFAAVGAGVAAGAFTGPVLGVALKIAVIGLLVGAITMFVLEEPERRQIGLALRRRASEQPPDAAAGKEES